MSRERLVSANSEGGGSGEKEFNWGLRPKNLDEYIGQKETVDRLKIAIEASKLRGEPLDHLLLHGPPGLGKCITPDSLVATSNGLVEFSALIPAGLGTGESAPISTRVVGLRGVERASHIYCSGVVPTIRLSTSAGFRLEGTPHHPILTAGPNGPQWKRLDELSSDDFVAIGRGANVWGKPQRAQFRSNRSQAQKERSESSVRALHGQLCQSLGRSPSVAELRRAYCAVWEIGDTPTPWRVATKLGLPLCDGRKLEGARRQNQTLNFALSDAEKKVSGVELDADLGYLMGAVVGDGHVCKDGSFVVTCTEAAMQMELRAACEKWFGAAPQVAQPKDRAACLRFSARIGGVFREFGLSDARAAQKTVPAAIFASPRATAIGFLQGLFDADGHARTDGFEFSTRSEKLARGVQILLANLGIIARLHLKTIADAPQFTLWIGGHNAALFSREVGFRLERKNRAFSPDAAARGWCKSDFVPHAAPLLVALLRKSGPHSRAVHRAFDHAKRGDRAFTKTQVERLLALLPQTIRQESEFQTLRALTDERICWDTVCALEPSQNAAYDFVVPGSHSFLANGIYNHNTSLSYIIAEELGRDIALTSGPSLERPGDVMGFLVNAKEGDIIFIDEIHRLPRIVEEFLYSAMEDFIVNFTLDKGMYSKPLPIRLEKFTIVGATTRPAMLTRPLRDRFGLQQHFDFYTEDDLNLIVRRSAHILGSPIDEHGAHEVARRSRGTPRVANRLLRRIRDFAQVRADGEITLEVAKNALKLEGIDELGLDRLDHAVLNVIKDVYDGGPVGIEALAATLNEESDTIVDVVEPYLLKIGFLARTPAGRRITRRAYEYLGEPVPGNAFSPALSLFEEAQETDERLREAKRARGKDRK